MASPPSLNSVGGFQKAECTFLMPSTATTSPQVMPSYGDAEENPQERDGGVHEYCSREGVVGAPGIEPGTSAMSRRHSNHLSYAPGKVTQHITVSKNT